MGQSFDSVAETLALARVLADSIDDNAGKKTLLSAWRRLNVKTINNATLVRLGAELIGFALSNGDNGFARPVGLLAAQLVLISALSRHEERLKQAAGGERVVQSRGMVH